MKALSLSLLALLLATAPAGAACDIATADAAKGAKKYALCKACHAAEAGVNKVGPSLFGIVDRPAATVEGYAYSAAMQAFAATGAKWDIATLDQYLKKPAAFIPKNKMTFAGLNKDEDRCNVIAHISTFK